MVYVSAVPFGQDTIAAYMRSAQSRRKDHLRHSVGGTVSGGLSLTRIQYQNTHQLSVSATKTPWSVVKLFVGLFEGSTMSLCKSVILAVSVMADITDWAAVLSALAMGEGKNPGRLWRRGHNFIQRQDDEEATSSMTSGELPGTHER